MVTDEEHRIAHTCMYGRRGGGLNTHAHTLPRADATHKYQHGSTIALHKNTRTHVGRFFGSPAPSLHRYPLLPLVVLLARDLAILARWQSDSGVGEMRA